MYTHTHTCSCITPHKHVMLCFREEESQGGPLGRGGERVPLSAQTSAAACLWGAALEGADIGGCHCLSPALLLPALPPTSSLLSLRNCGPALGNPAPAVWRDAKQKPSFPSPRVSLGWARGEGARGQLHPSCLASWPCAANTNMPPQQPLFN